MELRTRDMTNIYADQGTITCQAAFVLCGKPKALEHP
jgi:hypothetical protein